MFEPKGSKGLDLALAPVTCSSAFWRRGQLHSTGDGGRGERPALEPDGTREITVEDNKVWCCKESCLLVDYKNNKKSANVSEGLNQFNLDTEGRSISFKNKTIFKSTQGCKGLGNIALWDEKRECISAYDSLCPDWITTITYCSVFEPSVWW